VTRPARRAARSRAVAGRHCLAVRAALLLGLRTLRRRPLGRALTPFAALPALALALAPPAGHRLCSRCPTLFTGMPSAWTTIGRAFLLLTALLWTAGAVHARGYIRDGPAAAPSTASCSRCAGNIGVTVAGDALSFYLFFALMTFAAYGLLVHMPLAAAALRAGRVYIGMAVAGEALLLAGCCCCWPDADRRPRSRDRRGVHARPANAAARRRSAARVRREGRPVAAPPLAAARAPRGADAGERAAERRHDQGRVLGWLRFLPLGAWRCPTLGAALIVARLAARCSAPRSARRSARRRPCSPTRASARWATWPRRRRGADGAAPRRRCCSAVAIYALHHALAKAALFLAVGLLPPACRRPLAHRARRTPRRGRTAVAAPLSDGSFRRGAARRHRGAAGAGNRAGSTSRREGAAAARRRPD
jgi:hypothetical protein